MRIRFVFQCLAYVVIVGLGSSTVRAQNIGVFAMGSGSSIFGTRDIVSSGLTTFSRYQAGEGLTLGTELSFARFLGVEPSYYLGRSNLELSGLNESHDIRQERASADLMVHAPKPIWRLRPYGAIGPEYDHLAQMGAGMPPDTFAGYPGLALYTSNKFGFNYGIGTDLRITARFALRLDVRDHRFGSPTYGLPSYIYPAGHFADSLVYSLGIVYRLRKLG